MQQFLKNIVSLILPITALIIVPRWVEKRWIIYNDFQMTVGCMVMIFGLTIVFICIATFIQIGKGTLAPWSPPKNFVVTGLYQYVRNPMILGVLTTLVGEAILFDSFPILKWAGWFFVINTTYFFALEEPQLEERFGEEYRSYKKQVNRWLPKLTPYKPTAISKQLTTNL